MVALRLLQDGAATPHYCLQDWGKIVNKEKFTKFKAEQDEKAEAESRARAERRSSSPEAEVVQKKRRSRSRDRGRSTSPDIKRRVFILVHFFTVRGPLRFFFLPPEVS